MLNRCICSTSLFASIVLSAPAVAWSVPEILVAYGQFEIPDNNNTNVDHQGTKLSNVSPGSTRDLNYRIANLGDTDLTINLPVVIDGLSASEFTVTIPPPASVSAGGTAFFTIQYAPDSAGTHVASVTINSDDSDEGSYTFALEAISVAGLPVPPAPDISLNQGLGDPVYKCKEPKDFCKIKGAVEAFSFNAFPKAKGTWTLYSTSTGYINADTPSIGSGKLKGLKPWAGNPDPFVIKKLKYKGKSQPIGTRVVLLFVPDEGDEDFSDNYTSFAPPAI